MSVIQSKIGMLFCNLGTEMVTGGWIFEHNLQAFLELLAFIVDGKLTDGDYFAVKYGIEGTNDELDIWFPYQVEGTKRKISFEISDDPGSCVFHVRMDVKESDVELIQLALFVSSGPEIKCDTPYD